MGRFRYCNDLTPTGLGKAAGLGGAIALAKPLASTTLAENQQNNYMTG
ncbi:hypothetical protein [Nostoc sp.]